LLYTAATGCGVAVLQLILLENLEERAVEYLYLLLILAVGWIAGWLLASAIRLAIQQLLIRWG
jgi:hypothetical protein